MGCDFYIQETLIVTEKHKTYYIFVDYIDKIYCLCYNTKNCICGDIEDVKNIVFTQNDNIKKWFINDIKTIKTYIDLIKQDKINFCNIIKIETLHSCIDR